MKPIQFKAKIVRNTKVGPAYWQLAVEAPAIARAAVPGQFAMLKVCSGTDPLLRRPLGVHGVKGNRVIFMYEVVGRGTQALTKALPGHEIDIIGPLGNGFHYKKNSPKYSSIIVAGGMGVVPLLFLAQQLVGRNEKPVVLIGGRTMSHIVCKTAFKAIGCDVKISTDDGSAGFNGRVTELLASLLAIRGCRQSIIYSCGPKPMLKAVSAICLEKNIPAQVSLEEHMSCGMGACRGCVVDTIDGYKRVCKEGPVFEARQIIWK
ncbi:MAG TPA: dihydroorotate dehydrogenase electron transfer subunit [Candidatus Omnitrophota bacterium]|nr:dihydroorotate dehydrogenase electron transfer subunit [Candidatus Omnitrophota bacterium]